MTNISEVDLKNKLDTVYVEYNTNKVNNYNINEYADKNNNIENINIRYLLKFKLIILQKCNILIIKIIFKKTTFMCYKKKGYL